MRLYLLFTFLLIASNVESKGFPSHIVSLDNDTIFCYLEVQTKSFSKTKINPGSINNGLIGYFENDKRLLIKPENVKSIHIHETDRGTQDFYSMKFENKWSFVKVMATGKINLFMRYSTHGYDGGTVENYLIQAYDKEPWLLSMLLWKRELKDYFEDNTRISALLDKAKLRFKTLPKTINTINKELRLDE